MATTCAHGFAPADCLICRTLGASTTTTDRPRGAPRSSHLPGGPVVPSEVLGPSRTGGRRVGGHLALALVGVIVVAVAVFLVAGVVFTILRLVESVILALGAGWVGYRIGYSRGSHGRARNGKTQG